MDDKYIDQYVDLIVKDGRVLKNRFGELGTRFNITDGKYVLIHEVTNVEMVQDCVEHVSGSDGIMRREAIAGPTVSVNFGKAFHMTKEAQTGIAAAEAIERERRADAALAEVESFRAWPFLVLVGVVALFSFWVVIVGLIDVLQQVATWIA